MYVAHTTHAKQEMLLYWMVVMAAALLAVLIAATRTAGSAEPADREAPVPVAVVTCWERLVAEYRAGNYAAARIEADALGDWEVAKLPATTRAALGMWAALAHGAEGDAEGTIERWERVVLPIEAAPWRNVGMAAALLELGRVEEAAKALDAAWAAMPGHPVVHYLVGVEYIERAWKAEDWLDAVGPRPIRLAAFERPRVAPNTKSMYHLAAATELENAVRTAAELRRDEVLIAPYDAANPALMPTMGDLLVAIGAEPFVGKAELALGQVELDRGYLDRAEDHFDRAVLEGMRPTLGYEDLAHRYTLEERHLDAARAELKLYRTDPFRGSTGLHMLGHLGRAWRNVTEP